MPGNQEAFQKAMNLGHSAAWDQQWDRAAAYYRQALAQAAQQAGGLQAVVNNASTLGPSPQPALLDYPLDQLERVYQVNVFAALGLLQALRPAYVFILCGAHADRLYVQGLCPHT